MQLHPQLHHLDALDEMPTKGKGKARKEGEEDRPGESEARAIDVKIKAAEDGEAAQVAGNLDLLKKMQDEKWKDYEWVDAEVSVIYWLTLISWVLRECLLMWVCFVCQTEESWQLYENYMMHQDVDSLPQLQSAIDSESYLDTMSAPRIDPARPEMTGWAMKQNRMKQREEQQSAEGTTEG